MPRNNKKRFRKFLATRQQRWKKAQDGFLTKPFMFWSFISAVLVPLVFVLAYVLLWSIGLFSFLYPAMHVVAGIVWLIWLAMIIRARNGYWPYKTSLFFGGIVAVLVGFGACWQLGSPASVKAWISPPPYARLPSFELGERTGIIHTEVLEGSVFHVTWQGEGTAPTMRVAGEEAQLESGAGADLTTSMTVPSVDKSQHHTVLLRRGWLRLALWRLTVIPDNAPQIGLTEEPEITARKTIRFAYKASDDYGVEKISVRIAPTTSSLGVSMEPVELDLATPGIKNIEAANYADLTSLPWAGVPVTIQLIAADGAGTRAWSKPAVLTLPTRAFRNPFARALIEERQKLLQQPDATMRDETANVMAGIARQQGVYRGDPVAMMALRAGAVRLVLNEAAETVGAVANILWQTALRLEEGTMGKARQDLAEAERDLTEALLRDTAQESILPYLGRVHDVLERYFQEMENERARQPPALQGIDWPLATASEMLTPEDLQNRLSTIGEHIASGDRHAARVALAQMQSVIENLRTTPPELTPVQAQMVQQVSALRVIVRGQKTLGDETNRLSLETGKSEKARKARRDGVARALSQQQLLSAALQDIMTQHGLSLADAKQGHEAMQAALSALQQNAIPEAAEKQGEALSCLQKSLETISEQMRRSMTAKAP